MRCREEEIRLQHKTFCVRERLIKSYVWPSKVEMSHKEHRESIKICLPSSNRRQKLCARYRKCKMTVNVFLKNVFKGRHVRSAFNVAETTRVTLKTILSKESQQYFQQLYSCRQKSTATAEAYFKYGYACSGRNRWQRLCTFCIEINEFP